MNLGERIKFLRKQKGLTQADLSEKSGLTLRTIQRIENGEVQPSIHSIKVLEESLQANLRDLLIPKENQFEIKLTVTNMNTILQNLSSFLLKNKFLILGAIATASLFFNFSVIKNEIFSWWDDSTVEVSETNCDEKGLCDILLVKIDKDGNTVWEKTYGGSSYEKVGDVVKTVDNGYLIVGSTSSYGKGNYDIIAIKVNSEGEMKWMETYGGFFNEYGYEVSQIGNEDRYKISGTQQVCTTANVSNDCRTQNWIFEINGEGTVME